MTDETRKGGMLCPHCQVDLVMSERQGIEIDYCPQCRGVWLDRGELDKIIERSMADQPASAPTSQGFGGDFFGGHGSREEHGGGHGGGHRGKRRGFLHSLFD
ncbi:TFIIB-type zinc ribbon-containing protein [Sphingomonas oryzagri]|uniref:Zf-TFIIB domain-containing protein n=1 Tax=Sphingomonas oryzagri TaxID=3042314 RepID=A0ABT6N578_9SPHN|nr:zf-TFIIB domain-containing protein [Sphingomonas oryzagri]MDH7640264.1 zf-TFIIB domain-containing protein [Sphingomonas oryzagri]